MIKFPASIRAWHDPGFNQVLKEEICNLDTRLLPLQQGLQHSNYALDDVSATILESHEEEGAIVVKAGLFYSGIIAGCSCADDPTPVDTNNEYCEVVFRINLKNAESTVALLPLY